MTKMMKKKKTRSFFSIKMGRDCIWFALGGMEDAMGLVGRWASIGTGGMREMTRCLGVYTVK